MADSGKPEGKNAPIVILGSMFAIALVGLSVVAINMCNRDERMMDPQMMPQQDINRLDRGQRR